MTIEQEATAIVEKCQGKLKLAAQLDREAEGFKEKQKDAQKRADALRAEVERLIVDPTQTEIALEEQSEEGEEWKDAETALTEAAEAEAGGPVEEAAAEPEPV